MTVATVPPTNAGDLDADLLARSVEEGRILVTNDKDFGEKVYREHYPHHGVIFLRLSDERAVTKIDILRKLLDAYTEKIADHFVVVTETKVRFGRRYLSANITSKGRLNMVAKLRRHYPICQRVPRKPPVRLREENLQA